MALIREFYAQLQKMATETFYATEEFERIFGKVEFRTAQKSCPVTDIDLIFSNILIDGDKWNVIDLEWTFDFPIPVNYLLYRAIVNSDNDIRIFLQKNWGKLDVDMNDLSVFEQMDSRFLSYVRGKEVQLCNMAHLQKRKSISDMEIEIANKEHHIQNITAELEYQKAEVEHQKAEVEHQKAEVEHQKAEVEHQKAEAENYHLELEGVLSSRSWRITTPLRKIAEWFRSIR